MSDAHRALDEIPIPRRMLQCRRDHRGYPIPFLMIPDSQITIDMHKMMLCAMKKLCMICGKKLDNKKWFIAGITTSQNRLFVDPAMHEECARYALRVCPFLSNSDMKYRKKYDENTIPYADPNYVRKGRSPTQVLMQTSGYKIVGWRGQVYVLANRWRYLEHWQDGKQVDTPPGYSVEDLADHIGTFDVGGIFEHEIAE